MPNLLEPPIFSPAAVKDWEFWQHDQKMVQKIRDLIKSIYQDGPLCGLGKPEKLRHRPGYSRRINKRDRLIYFIDSCGHLLIVSLVGHYE